MPYVDPSLLTTRAPRARLVRTLLVVSAAAIVLALLAAPANAHPTVRSDAVATWNANAGKAARAAAIAPTDNPLHESRMYAMTHVAIHDALNAIDRRYRPYALDTRAHGASVDAAVAAAARDVLVPVLNELPAAFPSARGVASVESDYAAAVASIPSSRAKTRGLEVGRAAAAAILALRAADGSDTPLLDPDYPQGTNPGEYRFTPDRPFAFAPGWGGVTPFVLRESSQFRPGPPYAVSSRKYTADFREVKRLGGDGVTTPSARSAEQTEVALFWVESSPLQWNRIARTVSAGQRLDPWQQARLFGLLNMALADGYVASFDTKYHYNYWRPVTAIRAAGSDGNPNTRPDATWTPLVTNPPIPDYDSAHSVEGGAAAKVLERVFGTDDIGFETCSLTLPAGTCDDDSPVMRSYTGFSQAAEENGVSRILNGFHFRKAVEEGVEHGRKIGAHAVDRFLRPVGGFPPGHGAFSDKKGKIAFHSARAGGDDDVWTMNPDGTDPVNLTVDSEAMDMLPNWRADGRKIVFMSDRETPGNPVVPVMEAPDFEIFVMNADGSDQTQVTFNELDDENPAWSPDGKRIVFERDFNPVRGEGDFDVLTMKANGTGEKNLTNSPGVMDQEPSWAPSGGRIAFRSDRDGDAEVYTMKANGSNLQQLTFNDAFDGGPYWSPDGRRIAFDSERDGNPEIYKMRANGGDPTRLTFNPAQDIVAAWSPNGRRLAFTSDRDGNSEVYTMRADGSKQVNRTNNETSDFGPDWQPLDDGNHRGDDD